jgi:DNA-binding NtrC family response regulator
MQATTGIKTRILIADDANTVHGFFAGALADWPRPLELVSAYDGRQCMDMLEAGDIDLAFIDINMPEMSGMEAVSVARYHGVKTFVTLMSVKATEARFEFARRLDAYEYLIKPFGASEIENVMRTFERVSAPTRALIVDDSATVRRMICKITAASIFRITTEEVGDGRSAIETFARGQHDIVFLDCNMPGINGLQTLAELRDANPNARVIMISSERNEERVYDAMALGAVDFIYKPFGAADVDRVLHKAYGLALPGLTAPKFQIEPQTLKASA